MRSWKQSEGASESIKEVKSEFPRLAALWLEAVRCGRRVGKLPERRRQPVTDRERRRDAGSKVRPVLSGRQANSDAVVGAGRGQGNQNLLQQTNTAP